MITKIIEGVNCVQRDVVYTDFGAITPKELSIVSEKSSGEFKTKEGRTSLLADVQYSWDKESLDYEFESDKNFSSNVEDEGVQNNDSELDRLYTEEGPTGELGTSGEYDSSLEDREYSAGQLTMRLVSLRRPLHVQLKELYREHNRVYKSKGKTMKRSDIDLIMEDFRYELLRIVSKAKDELNEKGGNMDTILKVSSIGGNSDIKRALMQMTILFKRIERAYESYGFIPRNYQVKLNDSLSRMVIYFVEDIYGPEIQKRKMESQDSVKEDN